MEREQAARSARLRLVGICVGKAGIEIEVHAGDRPRIAQSRRSAKSSQIVFGGQPLEERRELGKVAMAAEQAAVVTEPVRAKLEAARAKPLDALPIDRILRQRQVPG